MCEQEEKRKIFKYSEKISLAILRIKKKTHQRRRGNERWTEEERKRLHSRGATTDFFLFKKHRCNSRQALPLSFIGLDE